MTRSVRLVLVLVGAAACTPIGNPMQHKAAVRDDCAADSCRDAATKGMDATVHERDAATAAASSSLPPPPAAAADSGKPEDAGTHDMPTSQAGAAAVAIDAGVMQPTVASGDTLVPPDDAECEYIEVRARNDAAGAPFQVKSGDFLQCFLLDAGFDTRTQAFGFSPLVDNASVVTDMVLRTVEYSDNRGPVVKCDDPYPTHEMVAFWAPGADDWYYPKDMGIDLGRGLFILEVHYDNKGGAATDRSGIRVCSSKEPRPRTASMSWLGNRYFSVPGGAKNYAVSGRCTPANQTAPIHILRVFPFLNQLGRRVAMQVDRIDGTTQPLFDEPFDVKDRKIYNTPATVRVGDSVLSTCYFDNPKATSVLIGTSNDNELCHMLVLAYPAHALIDKNMDVENYSCAAPP